MSVISSIQNAAGNAFTSARVAVTRGVREEAKGIADAALGREQQEVAQMSTIEQSARQTANLVKGVAIEFLKKNVWVRALTNRYVQIALVCIALMFVYIAITGIGFISVTKDDPIRIVETGGCLRISGEVDIICSSQIFFQKGLEKLGIAGAFEDQACLQGAERVGADPSECSTI